jgi:REP element-mobilizing transposase RayT
MKKKPANSPKKNPVQLSMLQSEESLKKEKELFGGSLIKGHARAERPLRSHFAMHLILRSSKATGLYSMLHKNNKSQIETLIKAAAAKQNIRIYKFANVGNHLHMLIRVKRRKAYQAFIRAITGQIARIVLGAKKGQAVLGFYKNSQVKEKFWDYLPCTRLVSFAKKSYAIAKDYVTLNLLEGLGLITRYERNRLKTCEVHFRI